MSQMPITGVTIPATGVGGLFDGIANRLLSGVDLLIAREFPERLSDPGEGQIRDPAADAEIIKGNFFENKNQLLLIGGGILAAVAAVYLIRKM